MASNYIKLPPSSGGGGGAVDSVNGQTGVVVLTKSSIGLGNVNNTSDANKPVSTAQQAAIDAKVADAIVDGVTTIAPSQNAVFDALALKQTAGGQVTVPDGNATTPGLRFTTDNDTGLFQTGDGNLSISANGVLKVSVNQSSVDIAVNTNITGDLDVTGNLTAGNYPPTGNNNALAYFNGSGDLDSAADLSVDTTSGGIFANTTNEPNGNAGSFSINSTNMTLEPLQNSPAETWNVLNQYVNIDPTSTGFDIGTGGQAVRVNINNINHDGTSDIGSIEFISNSFELGNGTDPIDVKGLGYLFGFGSFSNNVNISGSIQGYGFQPSVASGATISNSGTSITAFYDNANIQTSTTNYTSINLSPAISEIKNNNNYTGINLNPNITDMTGNANATGIGIGGNYGTFNTGGLTGININPTATNVASAYGINVSMDNVTGYAGTVSSLVVQDLTISFTLIGDNNSYQIEYLDDVIAGSETASLAGQLITVHMDSGASTATQIKTAIEANFTLNANLTITVSGVGSNTQTAFAATNFLNGTNPATVKAAYFDGDVEITGALTFGGALSVGKLNAFGIQALADNGGTPASIHSLITQPTVAANVTVANADLLGVNTAMLLSIGDNAVVTTSFLGVSALGLPAVVTMGSGSTLDKVSGATFAISLDAGAGGGTIDEVTLCQALALPNGVTTINNLIGYKMDLPFGDPGTTSWGFYEAPGIHNYFAGDLLIGGTAGSDDTVTNSSVALEIKSTTKAVVFSNMTTVEKLALTAIPGMTVFDTTLNQLSYYDGTVWVNL